MSTSTKKGGQASAAAVKLVERLRHFALAFPETKEDFPWGHSAFKVREKVFAFLGADEDGIGMSVKLPNSSLAALELPFAKPTEYGLGKHGWVSASFKPKDKVPVALLESWMEESFRAVAPKTVVKALDKADREAEEKSVRKPAKAEAPPKKGAAKATPKTTVAKAKGKPKVPAKGKASAKSKAPKAAKPRPSKSSK